MKPVIKKQDLGKEFYTSERCHITELSNDWQDPELSIARARVEPGVSTAWHRLRDTTERYYIVSGTGLVQVGQAAAQQLNAGDVLIIPPMSPQRITNNGKEDLVFLALCTPRFSDKVYEEMEGENPC